MNGRTSWRKIANAPISSLTLGRGVNKRVRTRHPRQPRQTVRSASCKPPRSEHQKCEPFFSFGEPSEWSSDWLNQRGSLTFFGKSAREIVHSRGAEALPSHSNTTPYLPHKCASLSPIALKTGSSSPGDRLMTLSISAVAANCSSASSRSRRSCATPVTSLGATQFGVLPRFNVLGRCVFAALPPVFSRSHCPPEAQDKAP